MSNQNTFFPAAFATRMRREMRQNKITIGAFARFSGMTQARVREVRNTGRAQNQEEWLLTLRDCVAASKGGAQ